MSPDFTPLTPHLWVRQSRSLRYNAGVFISAGQAVLVDPGLFPDECAHAAALLVEQRARPHTLVVTHSHWDHVLGPEHFPGVPVLAQARYPALAAEFADDIAWGLAQWEQRHRLERRQPFVPPAAAATVAAEGQLEAGGLRLQLRHLPGHAPDQLAVYQAESGVLWASDLLSDTEIPIVSDSLAAYQRTLAELAGWDLRLVVPGHGTPAQTPAEIRARLARDRAYLAELGERVGAAVAAGRSLPDALTACAAMDFPLRDRKAFDHRLNVESVFLELGGPGDPRRLGWNQDWRRAPVQWEGD